MGEIDELYNKWKESVKQRDDLVKQLKLWQDEPPVQLYYENRYALVIKELSYTTQELVTEIDKYK